MVTERTQLSPSVIFALVGGNVALALGPYLVRLADVGPTASAMWRMALAMPLLLIITLWRGQFLTLPRPSIYVAMVASGLFFAADLATWHVGIGMTKLANSTLFANAASLFFPIWGFIVAKSLPSRREGTAYTIATVGTALLLGRSAELSSQNLAGDLFCLTAGICYTGYLIIIMRARDLVQSWTLLFWTTLATILPLLLTALWLKEAIMPSNWTPVIALALCSQIIGQGLMVFVLGKVSPLVFGLALMVQPIISALIGWLRFGEALGTMDWIGALLVGLAFILIRQPEPNKN